MGKLNFEEYILLGTRHSTVLLCNPWDNDFVSFEHSQVDIVRLMVLDILLDNGSLHSFHSLSDKFH